MAEKQQSTQFKMCKNQLMPDSGKQFYLDTGSADVHFSFDLAERSVLRVAAHKILLAVASDVFNRMFYGELKENGDVKIVDASDAAFIEFLQYFYLSEVKLTEENIAGVIGLGHKYNVKNCIEDGIQFLIDILSEKNICVALHLASLYDHEELVKACETFIIVNTTAVFESNGFLECDNGVLKRILRMNVLSCSEVEVFEACMEWVKAKCGEDSLSKEMVDTHLGRLYYEIRFATMTIQQFCSLTTKYDSVLRSDYFTLTNMIVSSEFQSGNFIKRPRQAKWNEHEIITCDRAFGDDQVSYLLKPAYRTTFTSTKPLLLGKFMCSKIRVAHTTPVRSIRLSLPINVEITETNDLKSTTINCILKMQTKLQSEDTDVSLPYPVLIRPGFFYSICIEQFPDEHTYYSKELKTEVRLESDATIKFHNYVKGVINEKAVVVGLISALNFNNI